MCTFLAFAQEGSRTTTAPNHPMQEIRTYTPQQEHELAKQIPKDYNISPSVSATTSSFSDGRNPALSAEASSSIRYKDIPVNLATGAMSLPIPLYNLTEGNLSVPISIAYNGSGMKNQEVASWCGAGWSLNAGGMITRMVRGIPDEGVKSGGVNLRGYYKFGFGGNGTPVNNDTEPDIFYLNINGASYKMMYRYNGQSAKFEFFPDADIKVVPTFQFLPENTTIGKFIRFEVTLPDCGRYVFGNGAIEETAENEAGFIQSSGNYPGTTGFNNFWRDNSQTSVWYLNRIISPYGQEINFYYDLVRYSYYRIADHGVDNDQTLQAVCPDPSQVTKEINRVLVQSATLAKIIGGNTKIEINQKEKVCTTEWDPSSQEYIEICEYVDLSNPRIDIDQWQRYPQNYSNAKRLNEILVMDTTPIPKDTLVYKFNFGYFYGENDDLPTGYSTNNSFQTRVGFTHHRRLRLEKISFPDQTNVCFRYKGDGVSYNGKSRLDYGIDHWGYANGFTGNRLLTGLIPRDSDYPTCTPNTSNRESDPNFGFYGSLDSVIYSNRKTVSFEYELHSAKNYTDNNGNLKPIGGPRIKSISSKDLISGIETKKEYDYTLNELTTGQLVLKPTYRYKTPNLEIGSSSSIYDRLLGEMGRSPVVYRRVTEQLKNTLNESLGKTVYYFDNDTTELTTFEIAITNCTGQYPNQVCDTSYYLRPEKVHASIFDGKWDHKYQTGNLIRTEVFNQNNDTLSINIWNYDDAFWNGSQTIASKVFNVNGKNLGYTTCCGGVFTQSYSVFFTKFRLNSTISKTFSQTGTNPLTSTVKYVYKDEMPLFYQVKYPGKHNQLVKTETKDSKGNFLEQYTKYTADFEFSEDTIHVEETCYDEYGYYDCSYDYFVPHVPQTGSQARGIFEFKFFNILNFLLETNVKLNNLHLGSTYNSIASFFKPSSGLNYAPNKSFSSGNIGGVFTDIEYFRTPNDTITKEPSYFLNNTILDFNDFGIPTVTNPYAAAKSEQSFDASKLLINGLRYNVGGVIVDSSLMYYDKKLFGINRTIGINKLENIIVFDSTNKKGAVKQRLDKDHNILSQIDYLEPFDGFTSTGISLDNSKYRIVSRSPRIATGSLPDYGDSLDVDVAYNDANGRILQKKSLRASPSRKDIIGSTPIFDSFGRPIKSILPVNALYANGSFESNVLAQAQTSYADTEPVSEVTKYEASPLSRAFKRIGPGDAFRPNKESIVFVETGNFGIQYNVIYSTGYLRFYNYAGNQIAKTIQTDENGNKSISFVDKEGRPLESWVQFTGDGSQPSHFLKTIYLYDYLQRPLGVIPPILYGQIPDSTHLVSSPYINAIHFSLYDSRGRLVEKHVPDAGWSYVVYNRLGQVVLTQNPRQRQMNIWLWSKYDARGKNVLGGTLVNYYDYTREELQNFFDEFYFTKQFEERLPYTSPLQSEGYTVRSFPYEIQALPSTVMMANYYDDYSWILHPELAFSQYKTARWPYSKGLLTGKKVRNLENSNNLYTAFYYDDKNRLIQSQSLNRFGKINQTDLVLDFIGQTLENRSIYRRWGVPDLHIATKYTYDHSGRKLRSTHFLNNKPELLATYEYDELGRLIQKNINEASQDSIKRQLPVDLPKVQDVAKKFILLEPGAIINGDSLYLGFISSGLQKVNFDYDIRGNLRCINCLSNGKIDSSKVFAMQLDYFQDGRFYNGLLSKQTWNSSRDSVNRYYQFDYDNANRLKRGLYSGMGSENYSVPKISYDANGNIDSLLRNGKINTNTFGLIDELKYNYISNSNKISSIDDRAQDDLGFKNTPGSDEYTYCENGDLKADINKGITNIEYNYLGLINKVHFGPSKRIENIYASDGVKMQTNFIIGSSVLSKHYIGELIYVGNNLKSVWHDEGRVTFDNRGKATYQYFINDHQGNTRLVFQKQNDSIYIAQRIDYGVGGDVIANDSTDQNLLTHLYQGNEWLDGFGYDFVTRTYDPYVMRFLQVDGANQFASGYTGIGNNPVSMVDPDGQIAFVPVLIGASIFGGINLGGQAIKGNVNNFKQGLGAFGMGAISGGLAVATGGSSLTFGQLALQAAISQIPGVNVDLGSGFSFNLNPSLMMGTQGFSLGANVGVGYSNGNFSAGISSGAAFGRSNITGVKGWNGRIGGGVAFDNGSFYGSLGTMQYFSGETPQSTGTIGLGGGGFNLHYENDFMFGIPGADGGDRFRTAALNASYKDISVGFNLFTGDPGLSNRISAPDENGIDTYISGTSNKYRLGAAYLGYKNIKVGRNSENIRNVIQNRVAHDILRPGTPHFKVLNLNTGYYGNVGTKNPFSLW